MSISLAIYIALIFPYMPRAPKPPGTNNPWLFLIISIFYLYSYDSVFSSASESIQFILRLISDSTAEYSSAFISEV